MIFKAFLAFTAVMSRLNLKDDDIEIVIRCRTPLIEDEVARFILDDFMRAGTTYVTDAEHEALSMHGQFRHGTIHGMPFRLEVKK